MKKYIVLFAVVFPILFFSCQFAEKEALILVEEEAVTVGTIESRQGLSSLEKWEEEQVLADQGKQVIDHEATSSLMQDIPNGSEFDKESNSYKKLIEIIKKHKLEEDQAIDNVLKDANQFKVVYAPVLKDIVPIEKKINEVEGVKIIFSIPKNEEEYTSIFKEYSEKNLERMQDIASSLDFSRVGDARSSTNFLEMLANTSDKEPIILIGHNDDGLFYFPDGSTLLLIDLDRLANEKGKRIIVLSCNAGKYLAIGPRNALTYEDSMEIAYSIAEKEKGSHLSLMDADELIKDFESDKAFERKVSTISKVTAVSAGTGGVIVITLPDHKHKHQTV